MAGKKRLTPLAPRARKRDEDSDDEDDVPLARILQRRRLAAKASPKRKNGARTAVTATNATVLPLNEVVERCIIELLPVVPDRQRVEAVCRRWRRLSREELPVTELDFGQVALRPLLRRDVSTMLGRASQQLTRLILPDITLVDAHIELVVQQQNLRVFRAHRMQKKHIFNILKHCPNLKVGNAPCAWLRFDKLNRGHGFDFVQTLELLDCRALTLSGWPRDAVALREVYLNGCNFVTNQAASLMIKVCGNTLEKVILTEAMNLDSQILRDLARHAGKLEELTISNCTSVRLRDLQALTEAIWGSLRWLDLASCRGISSFPDATSLPKLQVLLLDKSKINDDGLRGISRVAPSLRYLSLQDCRAISDNGITALASSDVSEGCTSLEIVDLKGTPVTDTSLHALEAQCPRLHLVRVDSCRSVSRKMRSKYNERARRILAGGRLSKCERIFAERKKIEMIDPSKSSSESDESESDQDANDDYVIEVRRSGASYWRRR
ncbi:Leucine-rich repeat domain, L domain-like [Phytophthora cactorum]|nr:Leucine-rich repeat domain, L domain-like [Phytophthora cactorum]